MSEPEQYCRRRHLSYSVVGAAICPWARILTEAYDNHYGPGGKLASSIVTDVRSLHSLLLVGSWISTLVRCADRRSGMGRDHLLTKPEHGIISGQTPSAAQSGSVDMHPAWSYPWHRLPCQRGSLRGKGGPSIFEGPPWPLVFLLSPICNPCFPLVYKKEGRVPH